MTDLKIRIYASDASTPKTTVTIPGAVMKIASRLIPKKAQASLQEKGIDLNEIVRLADNPEARGTLVEIEDHEKNEKIVIALE